MTQTPPAAPTARPANSADAAARELGVFPFGLERRRQARGWRALVLRLLPLHLADGLRRELWAAPVRLLGRRAHRKFRGQRQLLVNIGSGGSGRAGWVNLDLYPAPGVTCLCDARSGLPFEPGSVRAIFTEHVLEHLDDTEEVPIFFSHGLCVLEPGGLLRIVVPDAEEYLRACVEGTWAPLLALRPLSGQRDHWLGGSYHTRMEVINAVFRQGIEHRFAYDAETLCFALEHAGFHRAQQRDFGESQLPEVCLDNFGRASESLYVGATKNVGPT